MFCGSIINLIIVFLVLRIVRGTPVSGENQNSVLQTKAESIRSYMNERSDPCDNFYNYACGSWPEVHPYSDVMPITNPFYVTHHEMERTILNILTTAGTDETEVDTKVKHFYNSCLNLKSSSSLYKDKLKDIVREFGQMPVLEQGKWQEGDFDWLKTVSEIARQYDITIMLGYKIRADPEDSSKNRLMVVRQDYPLKTASMYLDDQNALYRFTYRISISERLQNFLGLTSEVADQTANEILDFETALVVDDDSFVKTSIEEMQNKYYPDLDFKKMMNLSLGLIPADEVYELFEDYQRNLVMVLKRTPKRIVANYVFYNLLLNFMTNIQESGSDLQAVCLEKTKLYFSKNLDNMIYRRTNNKEAEEDIHNMWHEIRMAFEHTLKSDRLNWMGESTRKAATEKLNVVKLELNSYENFNFSQDFQHLTLSPDDYLENLKSIFSQHGLKARNKINEPPQTVDDKRIASLGPSFLFREQIIQLPVAVMQSYFWSAAYPKVVNFASLGSMLAHELIHGFDDKGSQFDKEGNNRQWWDEKSEEEFENRSMCFRDQYKQYHYNGRHLPEMKSQTENIADNGGLKLAYEAYMQWYEKASAITKTEDLKCVPGLNYNHKQMFFITFAQNWCGDIHPWARSFLTSIDNHVPDEFRVIGPLSNFEEFSNVFNCSRGSAMNPIAKCQIY